MRILVTGGAGFIGSAFVRLLSVKEPDAHILNFDKLTYAGNLENLLPLAGNPRYSFVRGDICDAAVVESTFAEFVPDAVVHFAAESHVDRSILWWCAIRTMHLWCLVTIASLLFLGCAARRLNRSLMPIKQAS